MLFHFFFSDLENIYDIKASKAKKRYYAEVLGLEQFSTFALNPDIVYPNKYAFDLFSISNSEESKESILAELFASSSNCRLDYAFFIKTELDFVGSNLSDLESNKCLVDLGDNYLKIGKIIGRSAAKYIIKFSSGVIEKYFAVQEGRANDAAVNQSTEKKIRQFYLELTPQLEILHGVLGDEANIYFCDLCRGCLWKIQKGNNYKLCSL